ncbi:putative FMN-binding domain-containing protein [Dendryphion nanum]|uniref:FMN-binding domain-containing protein n=1 Tax=Dendryphion nanum TaxID=256645 RepID=A0A9P9IHP0_9PLEO|nr:putative FMN-binding domain-containing protein [Dendryphion nanum]
MYLRAVHAESHVPSLHQFIHANPLGIFTTGIKSPSFPFLQSSHIPWVLDISDDTDGENLGTLRGHMARANPQAKSIIEHLKSTSEEDGKPRTLTEDVMILFNGPAHHYVTPKFYRETKPTTGKVVPTWNYSAVQVYGRATIYFDSKSPTTSSYLDKQIRDLSNNAEKQIMGFTEKPWEVDDAPVNYVEALKKAIIGLEIEITDLGGKWKMSQEMSKGDREGVAEGFEGLGSEVGRAMGRCVREKGEVREKSAAASAGRS